MLPKRTIHLFYYFDACGFNSGLSKLSISKKSVNIINIVHILMATLFTLYKIRLIIKLLSLVQMVEVINFTLQYSVALYTYWIIIFNSNIQKRQHELFWRVIHQIDEILSVCLRYGQYFKRCIWFVSIGCNFILLLFFSYRFKLVICQL